MPKAELLDVLDETGKPIGQTKTKGEILRAGDWRAVIHVWIVDDTGNLLIQRRSHGRHKRGIFDGLWDTSVGGGVRSGEDSLTAAIREVEEEVGLAYPRSAFHLLGRWKIPPKPVSEGRVMKDFSTDFLVHVPVIDPQALKLQAREVAEVSTITLSDLRSKIQDPAFARSWVPHGSEYYMGVVDRIMSVLGHTTK